MGVLEQFRPDIWSRQLIVDTDKAYVFSNIVTTKYQGEAGFGKSVKINELGDVTISDYTSTGTLSYEDLSDAQKILYIDQQKSFSFKADDIATVQSNVEFMSGAMSKSADAIANVKDKHLAGLYGEAGVSTSNLGTSGSSQTIYGASTGNDGVLGMITNMHRYLNDANAPTEGRWAVIPTWLHAYLNYAGLVDNVSGGMKQLPNGNWGNGFIGNVLGFNFFVSTNVSNDGTQYRVMFGTPGAIGHVSQIEKVRAMELEDSFAVGVSGLYVYGSKVVRPDRLGVAYIAEGGLST